MGFGLELDLAEVIGEVVNVDRRHGLDLTRLEINRPSSYRTILGPVLLGFVVKRGSDWVGGRVA
jgi:hypothetical protein